MRNIYALVTAFLIAAVSFAFSASAQPVDPLHVEREVLFMLAPEVADLDHVGLNVPLDLVPLPLSVRAELLRKGILVISRAMPDFRKADTLTVTPDGRPVRFPDWTNYLLARVPPPFSPDTLVAALEALDEVLWANRNQMLIYGTAEAPAGMPFNCPAYPAPPPGEIIPADPFFSCQWALKNTGAPHQGSGTPGADIRATFAWPYTTGSRFIKLGIIDTGVDGSHVDLSGRVFGATVDWDPGGHGTHVAGIAAASANNPGGGIAGVDWNTSIHSRAAFTVLQATQAVTDLVHAGAHVINNSWVVHQFDHGLYTAFRNAFQNGRVLVTGATPDYALPGPYPSGFGQWILNVTAVNNEDRRAHYTIPARHVDIAAPGGEAEWYTHRPGTGILSTLPWNNWGYDSGTSMAAPHVSGAATLMLAAEPNRLRNFDIEHILKRTAHNWPNHTDQVGYGLINVEAALKRLHAPYTITQGQAQFNQFLSNQRRTFTVSPAPGIAAGTYWVDGYEFVASASFSYQETPWAWLSLTDKGFSYANPNNAERWMSETVSLTHMELKTVFYFIRTNLLGQRIDRWVPFDPRPFPALYTVLGIPVSPPQPPPPPLSVMLSGDTWLEPGHQGQWFATASGGTSGDYTFRWFYNNHLRRTHTTSSNQDSYSDTAGAVDFTIRVEVDRGNETASAQLEVRIRDCQADPTIPCVVAGGEDLPARFELYGHHPNPLTTSTTLRFALPEAAEVRVVVVDLLGREVLRTGGLRLEAGFHQKVLDMGALPSGVYLYRFEALGENGLGLAETRAMTVVR